RRAARLGAHLALADFVLESCVDDHRRYREALEAHGRDPAGHEVAAVASVFLDEDSDRAWELAGPHVLYQQNQYLEWFREAGDRASDAAPCAGWVDERRDGSVLVGTPDEVLDRIRRFHAAVPFTHFSFWCLLPGLRLPCALGSLELFCRDVLPALRTL